MPTTYYIRKTGADANNGTSSSTAWLTIGKALGTAGLGDGDTVYVGAGTYREVVTVAMTSATAETSIIGDIDGVQTGDAGEVYWTNYTTNDHTVAVNTVILTLAGRDFLTFKNIIFINGASTNNTITAVATSTDIKIINCVFSALPANTGIHISITIGFGIAANWVIDKCLFVCIASYGVAVSLTSGTGSDYDTNITIKNSVFNFIGSYCIFIIGGGTSAQLGGGVDILNCFMNSYRGVYTSGLYLSTSIPCTVNNCIINSPSNGLNAGVSGQIIENYNLINSGIPRTLVTAGAYSISDGGIATIYEFGQSMMMGLWPRPMYAPIRGMGGMSNMGNDGNQTTYDFYNAPRSGGEGFLLSIGTVTAAGTKTLVDSTKTWGTNIFVGCTVKTTGGTANNQYKSISANTGTSITVDGNWNVTPGTAGTATTYIIFEGALSSSGKATTGGTTTLTDANAAWGANQWRGYTLNITAGSGSGQMGTVASNTTTVLTHGTLGTVTGTDSTYEIYRGGTITTANVSPGAVSAIDTAQKETVTVRTGINALSMLGAGYQDFEVPIDAGTVAATVYVQRDTAYAGVNPIMSVLNGTYIGVANASATAVGNAGAWEQLSLSIVSNVAGAVTIRLTSAGTTNDGRVFWDDFAVT